jgi:hypothetical protein
VSRSARATWSAGLGPAVLLVLMTGVAACTTATPSVSTYQPTIAGVVASRDLVGADLVYRFTDGRTFSIPVATRTFGAQPDVGALLVSGTEPEPWLIAIEPRPRSANDFVPPGCFELWGRARSTGRSVLLRVDDARGQVEIEVPEAASWVEPKHREGSDELIGTLTCLNNQGQATLRH